MSTILFLPRTGLSNIDNKFPYLPNTTRYQIYSYLDKRSVFALYRAFAVARRDIKAHPEVCTFLRANQLKSVVWKRSHDLDTNCFVINYYFNRDTYYVNPRSPIDWKLEFQKERIIKNLRSEDLEVSGEPLSFMESKSEKAHHLLTESSKGGFYFVQEKIGNDFEDRVYDLSKSLPELKDKKKAETSHKRTRRWLINGTDFEIQISNDLKEIKVRNISSNQTIFCLISDKPINESDSHIVQSQEIFLFKVYKKNEEGTFEAEVVLWNLTYNQRVLIKNKEFLDGFCTEKGKTTLIVKPEPGKSIVTHEVDWSKDLAQTSTNTSIIFDGTSTLLPLTKDTIFVSKKDQNNSIVNLRNGSRVVIHDMLQIPKGKFGISKTFQKILIYYQNHVQCFDFTGKLLKTFSLQKDCILQRISFWEHRAAIFYYQDKTPKCLTLDLSNIYAEGIQIDQDDVRAFFLDVRCSGGLCIVEQTVRNQQSAKIFDLKDMSLIRVIPLQTPDKLVSKNYISDSSIHNVYLINGVFVDSLCGNKISKDKSRHQRQITRTLTYCLDNKIDSGYLSSGF